MVLPASASALSRTVDPLLANSVGDQLSREHHRSIGVTEATPRVLQQVRMISSTVLTGDWFLGW